MSNVKWVNDSNLCHGCGACDAVCPHDSITMVNSGKNNFPLIDMSCTDCGICEKACSGHQTTIDTSILESKEIYIAYSKIENIRESSSSGGFITQYLLDLFDNNKINGAIVTYSDGTMKGTKSIIAHSKEEIISSMGSKYYPSSNCSVLKDLDYSKKYAFVGKGCDLESLYLMGTLNKKIIESIYIKIGLMCHHTPHADETKMLLNKYGFKVNNKTHLHYRSDGWPGQTIIKDAKKEKKIDYKISWGENLGINVPIRCQICTQSIPNYADIIVGDAWSQNKNLNNMSGGLSLIIGKTQIGINEINNMTYKGNISIEKSDNNTFIDSQINLLNKLQLSFFKVRTLALLDKNISLRINKINRIFSLKFILKAIKFNIIYFINKIGLK